jgi:hypothetical protein
MDNIKRGVTVNEIIIPFIIWVFFTLLLLFAGIFMSTERINMQTRMQVAQDKYLLNYQSRAYDLVDPNIKIIQI